MIKLIIISIAFGFGATMAIPAARLLYRWGDEKIKHLQDKRVNKYLEED
jgi:hypothetical protein